MPQRLYKIYLFFIPFFNCLEVKEEQEQTHFTDVIKSMKAL